MFSLVLAGKVPVARFAALSLNIWHIIECVMVLNLLWFYFNFLLHLLFLSSIFIYVFYNRRLIYNIIKE